MDIISKVVTLICCIVLLIILIRTIVCPDRIFMTKKRYEKEQRKYKEYAEKLNNDYPTLISRMSLFFDISEDQIRDELKDIFNKE